MLNKEEEKLGTALRLMNADHVVCILLQISEGKASIRIMVLD